MLTIYKKKEDIPQGAQYVELNDLFFNQHTVMCLDGKAKNIIEQIDEAKILIRFKIMRIALIRYFPVARNSMSLIPCGAATFTYTQFL